MAMRVLSAVSWGLMAVMLARAGWAEPPIVVNDSELKKTYDCKGGTAVINGGENVLTLRNCAQVSINGGDNVIDAEAANMIAVNGSGNKVSWTERSDGSRPAITDHGEKNTITSKPGRGGGGPAKPAAKAAAVEKAPSADRPAGGDKPAKSAPAAPKAGAGSCAAFAGHWELSGSCGPDECTVTQQGCTVDLRCRGGAVSYRGSIAGNTFEFAGKSAAGIDATCKGTIAGKKLRGGCAMQGVPSCKFTATVASE